MKLGIVGHEAAKFTHDTEEAARIAIRTAIVKYDPTHVVSGHCHLGGVDIWAEEEGRELGCEVEPYPAKRRRWTGPGGFMERNLKIAAVSDVVVVIVVAQLPPGYTGMRFERCYHCLDRNPEHVKSGACWTAWRAPAREWVVI